MLKNLCMTFIVLFCFGMLLFSVALGQTAKTEKRRFESVSKGKVGEYGYTEVFQTDDKQILVEGIGTRKNKKAARSEFADKIRQAAKILDNSKSKKRALKRAVLDLGDNIKRRFLIVKYDGNKEIKYIAAENLELALEFERWEKSQ